MNIEKHAAVSGTLEQPGERARVVLVLLAAGDSVRFGGTKPMYRHLADEIQAASGDAFYRKLVVSQYSRILTDLGQAGFEPVENRDSRLGISHSIRLALEQMDGREDAVCFAVCDQPWLRAQTIVDMMEEKRQRPCLSVLRRGGRQSGPVCPVL